MSVTVEIQLVARRRLNNPGVASEHRALSEEPAREGESRRIQGSFSKYIILLQQVPRVLGQALPTYLRVAVVADLYSVAFFASI